MKPEEREDKAARSNRMDRYDRRMNQHGHYSVKKWREISGSNSGGSPCEAIFPVANRTPVSTDLVANIKSETLVSTANAESVSAPPAEAIEAAEDHRKVYMRDLMRRKRAEEKAGLQ